MTAPEADGKALSHTNKPPCCLRIFRDDFIILGTYDLDKPSGARTGSIDILDKTLGLLETYETYGAVLDLKLSPFDDTLMATAHSTGNVELWRIECESAGSRGSLKLLRVANLQVFVADTLITSLHFSPRTPESLLVTATSGETRVLDLKHESEVFASQALSAHYSKLQTKSQDVQGRQVSVLDVNSVTLDYQHALECWTAEYGCLSPFENIVFTGGDDSAIAAHDLRTLETVWSNSRIHEAGVVAIKCSTDTFRVNRPTSIVTGSYDDHIRSLDLRMMGDSIYPGVNVPVASSSSSNLGGGVWRFVESPQNTQSDESDKLLVCCMYNGAKILRVDGDDFVIESYTKKNHESMCYGGDWGQKFIATCSFYDKVVQLWDE
ncbi:LAQU0S02e10946g1_1 [Lachancea quebecensis]|uniref:methylated diphthine methylhydrolase n=1 Tax=Lachancea quebecensis TaxID=1654605 RepID=A0A0P1KP11_9SACH|nr:LAQU0S02e10946g1_1 [Lachancea quebecensis]